MKWIGTLIVCVTLAPMLFPIHASEWKSGERIVIAADQTVTGDLFAAGETVEIYGTVTGDVYAAAGRVMVDGVVEGDVLAAGGTVTVGGTVGDDVRIAGGTITVSGDVRENLTMAGGNITLSPEATINGSAVAAGGNVTIAGVVGSDLVTGAGTLVVSGSVMGDGRLASEDILFSPGSEVAGRVEYWSSREARVGSGAVVTGGLSRNEPPRSREKSDEKEKQQVGGGAGVAFSLIGLLSNLVVGLLFLKVSPAFLGDAAERVKASVWRCLGSGMLLLIMTPVVILLLFVTVLGIPLAGMVAGLFGLAIYASKFPVALAVMQLVKRKFALRWNDYILLAVGLVLMAALSYLPVLGWLAGLASLLVGSGAVILAKRDLYLKAKKARLV